MPTLILGTANRKKGHELAGLFDGLGLEILTLADVSSPLTIIESGSTFADNARLKATQQAAHLRRWVLADDSGLAVDALGGSPGVHSARYAGETASDEDNRRRLLAELAGVPAERRSAHFVCWLTLADPSGHIQAESEGRCNGWIVAGERGEGGFGYDPLFEVREYHRTFGELGGVAKSALSHRARAVGRILPDLRRLIGTSEWDG